MRIPFPRRPPACSRRAAPFLVALCTAGLVPASPSPAIASDGAWVTVNRLARYAHSAIVDVENDRMVIFGGVGGRRLNDVWTLSLHGAPTWSPLAVQGTPPTPRFDSAVAYDPVRHRMLVFGGRGKNPFYIDDLWELTLDSTPTWTQLVPSGTTPELYAPSVVFDSVRDRMLVFGSTRTDVEPGVAGTWELSLGGAPAWTLLDTAGIGPQPSSLPSPAVYDAGEDRMIVITRLPDLTAMTTWSLSLGGAPTWTLLDPSGTPPSVYELRSAVLDAERHQIVVPPYWTLTLGDDPTWTDLRSPSPVRASILPDDGARFAGPGSVASSTPLSQFLLSGSVAVFDGPRDRVVVSGGIWGGAWGSPPGDPTAGAAAINMDPGPGTPIWEELSPAGVSPLARGLGSAVRDRDRLILFGGAPDWTLEPSNEAWMLPLEGAAVWRKLEPSGTPPAPRKLHAAIVDPVRERMIVFGGLTGGAPNVSPLSDTWTLSLQGEGTWTELAPAGTPPDAGGEYMSIYDPEGDRMLVTSGARTWALDLEASAWSELTPSGPLPPPRFRGSAVYDSRRGRLLLPTGEDYNGTTDLWALSLRGDPTWTNLGPGLSRALGVVIYDPVRDRIVVHGGWYDCACPAVPGGCDCSYYDTWSRGLQEGAGWVQLFPADSSAWIRSDLMAGIYDPAEDRLIATSGSMTSALEFPPAIHTVAIDLQPRVINLASRGQWITARVEAADVLPADVDLSTALLAGSVPADPKFAEIGDHDGNGAADLLLKFPRAAVEAILAPGDNELDLSATLKAGGAIRGTGTVSAIGTPGGLARGRTGSPAIGAIEPNPFGASTSIRFDLPRAAHVRVAVYDAAGRLVATLLDGESAAGRHSVDWQGSDAAGRATASGVYFVVLDSESRRETRKVTLLR